MTFSLVACDKSGAIGMVVTSSSPCVASRCIHLRTQVGGVASQNVTDPRYGEILLNQIKQGAAPRDALDSLVASDKTIDYRQISVVDAVGNVASFSGKKTLGTNRVVTGDGAVAAGNLLSSDQVPDRMLEAYVGTPGDLEFRLLAALEAGEAAGGEMDEVRSCGLAVVRNVDWRETDLRVDWSSNPISSLRDIVEVWMPQRDDYVTRGLHPDQAPSYGVLGDN